MKETEELLVSKDSVTSNERERNSTVIRRGIRMFVAVLVLTCVIRVLYGRVVEREYGLAAVFAMTKPENVQATVEVTAKLPGGYLGEFDKKQLLTALAEEIGLCVTESFLVERTEQREEVSYIKEGKNATTRLWVVSLLEETEGGLETNHYIYGSITLFRSAEDITEYQKRLERTVKDLGGSGICTTVQLKGEYEGKLSLAERNALTDKMLALLNAKAVYEHREEELFTVYAYTAQLENCIVVDGNRLNVHVAVCEDENLNRTVVYLASPVLPDTW